MNDPRIRLLRPLVLAALAAAGCATTPPEAPNSLPVEEIVNDPAEVAFPDEATAPEPPPPELELQVQAEPFAPAVDYGDVLVRIRGQLSLPQVEHQRVDREIEWLQRNPDYLARVFGRAQRYLHYVANEVEARGMPGDLALLPVVESAFNPFAYSRSHASGLWQFIAPTGERYGLRRNYWQDQRRDVVDSTHAALDFLQHLRDRFNGDWFLAIAAYNYGPGNIQRAINRNLALRRKTDFFSLSLPAETRAYVPKLVALAKMLRTPEAYGFYLPPIPDTPYFRVVSTDGPVDLRLMSELAGVDSEELHALNPAWNRWVTDPDGPHRVLIPEVVADGFVTKLAALDANSRARLGVHTVAAGESLASIAGHYKVPENFIERVNAGKRADLRPGDLLWVPAGDVSQLRAGLGSDMERRTHRVRSGESLWSISRRYGMTVPQLARMNNLSAKVVLQPGQRLQVAGSGGNSQQQASAGETQVAKSGKVNYKVQRGDTLSGIARQFAVTVHQLQAWNNMGRSTVLRAGQFLTIHVGGQSAVGG
ncbi:MAG TPA: LysM peptidoglycan-binding domain-containing protein [Steroidobacteraceae bacterium]